MDRNQIISGRKQLPGECPFVFERTSSSWSSLAKHTRTRLMSKGFFSMERMAHVQEVVVVVQSSTKVQATVAKNMDIPHGQCPLASGTSIPDLPPTTSVSLMNLDNGYLPKTVFAEYGFVETMIFA